ncbi:MAG TPA: hypothetical protein VHB46_01540 [Burkholderiales bacterium]|nr:hypothetical protein [Burkholderiales bacterium]
MTNVWPWLTLAGFGALHGLNPVTGWAFAAAWGVRSRDRTKALQALVPIAVGHVASIALVAGAITIGLSMDRVVLQLLAGGLFVVIAIIHVSNRMPNRVKVPAGHAGIALWSFMMSTAHGAGLMLVPALFALCRGNPTAGDIAGSGQLSTAIAAVVVHTAAMLIVTGLIASGFCRATSLTKKLPWTRSSGKSIWRRKERRPCE